MCRDWRPRPSKRSKAPQFHFERMGETKSVAHSFRGRGRPRHTISCHTVPRHTLPTFQPVVLLQHFAQTVMRQADDLEVVNPFHRFGRDHGIDNCFFRGLNGGEENGIHPLVG